MFDKPRVLALSKQLMDGVVDADEFYNELTLLLAEQMGSSRASLWVYPDPVARDRIQCLRLYDRDQDSWSQGAELREADFGPYFAAMRRDNLIVASEARSHPTTDCFTAAYFEPLGIYSLLDVGINIGGQPWGLFCCENTHDVLTWSDQHVEYLRQVGTLLGFALKKAQG